MKKHPAVPFLGLLASLLLVAFAAFACSDGAEDNYDGPEDPCRNQSGSCGSDMLHFSFSDILPDGAYRVTVNGDEEEEICTVIRSGSNEVDVPNFSVTCESQSFESQVSMDRYGLSIFEYQPKIVTLTIENTSTGCRLSMTEEPSYEALWSECGDTCIEAFLDFDVSELLTDACSNAMGGAGGTES